MLISDSGIPVPEGKVCRTLQQALTIAGKIGYPVVVKPEKGNQGKGVSLNITNSTDIAEAFNIAKKFDSNVLVEKYVPGKDYRVLVVNGRVVAVARRIPHGLLVMESIPSQIWLRYPIGISGEVKPMKSP